MVTSAFLRWASLACLCACLGVAPQAPAGWPPIRDGLLFAFATSFDPAYALNDDGKPRLGWQFTPKGCGRINRDGALAFFPGGFQADGLSAHWGKALGASHALTLTLRFAGEQEEQHGMILNFGGAAPLLRVDQQAKTLRVFAGNEAKPAAVFPFDGKPASLTATLHEGALVVYLNGVEQARATVGLPAEAWKAPAMQIGHAAQPRMGDWNGAVDHITLYDRALDPAEIAAYTKALDERIAARVPAERLVVRARLAGKSTVPTPEDIAPYTRGLCVFQYDVLEVLQGTCGDAQVHVAHWMILDETLLGFHRYPEGKEFTLVLERFDDNPQLATEYLSDDIVEDFSIPCYFDATGLSCRAAPGSDEPAPSN